MFDIAFSELLLIGLIALVVIGPERLPKVARTVGGWIGKLNRYVAQVKEDVDREMKLEELKRLQAEMKASAQKYEILAAETELKLKREMDAGEKLATALGVTDGPVAQLARAAVKEEEAEGPHAVIEYAAPIPGHEPALASLNAPISDEMPLVAPPDAGDRQAALF